MNILITGSRSGIAYDLIKRLAKNKKNKIYASTHTEEEKEILEEEFDSNKNVFCMKLDITNDNDIELVENMDIDILICNAAICMGGSILDVPIDKVRKNYEVNVFSTLKLIQIVANKMIEKDKGKIIVMGSISRIITPKFIGIYASTKSAIYTLTKTLSKEIKLLSNNVRVVLIEPGLYHTGFNQIMLEGINEYNDKSHFNKINKNIYLKQRLLFDLMEKTDTKSITNKIIEAINCKNPKLIYRAPISQNTMVKIYKIFK